jgi:hypothetical protein
MNKVILSTVGVGAIFNASANALIPCTSFHAVNARSRAATAFSAPRTACV